MTARLHPDRTTPAAARRRGTRRPVRPGGGMPGWRPWLAAVAVVAALALLMHLLYR